jgi:hypothetical protein
VASKTGGPTSTRNGHFSPIDVARKTPAVSVAKPGKGKDKGKKKRDKAALLTQENALDQAAAAPPSVSRGVARVFQQTVGDPPTPWPIYLLRHGLLLLVDGIDARYGAGAADTGEAPRPTVTRPRSPGA